MGNYSIDYDKYKALARQAAAEGCVLLKNDNSALPLKKSDKVAVFGRIAREYYKSGLGSGGLVNVKYVVGILDALNEEEDITLNQAVNDIYSDYIKANPFDVGKGWGQVPWCQKEMPVTDELLAAAEGSDVAIVVVGRTAGEDQDNNKNEGSYLLQKEERELIDQVSKKFPRTVVLLNVGNVIDMKWVGEYDPAAVMYVWQGGQEGGHGVADVLMGRVNPCGKLADTIAYNIEDYLSDANFGDELKNYYADDIYVGYRYFETFAKDKVLYPFGFGMSYTSFDTAAKLVKTEGDSITIDVTVTNTGDLAGKEVVQIYVKAPQGLLGKPEKVMVDFAKTDLLAPGEKASFTRQIPKYAFASYDDGGYTGNKSCYVLEEGCYEVFAGSDVESAASAGTFEEAFTVVEQLNEAYAPVENFKRVHPVATENGYEIAYQDTPTRTVDWRERAAKIPAEIPYTGDQGIKLADVYSGKNTMDEFVAQLSDTDLVHLFRGEGMCSPKVTPGTGCGFGGITESLKNFGVPAACGTDGPSGLRLDVGTSAFSLPNGAAMGCTYNTALVEELYSMTGRELRKNRVDTLLGPGLNIKRHPLNGRNFEYISEDPILAGKVGAAIIRGLNVVGSTGTIKHFCANNQEYKRRQAEGVISERALREIYLKVFELTVREGKARSVMTSYGPVNGLWTAGSYDLCTTLLRDEWGFEGIVMTDWWAEANIEGQPSNMQCHAAMAIAQNDLYMVCQDAADDSQDDMMEKLQSGELKRAQLQRNAKNILGFILKSPAMLYEMNMIEQAEIDEIKASLEEEDSVSDVVYYKSDENGDVVIDGSEFEGGKTGNIIFGVDIDKFGIFDCAISIHSDLDELAQLPVTVFFDNVNKFTVSFRGSNGAQVSETGDLGVIFGHYHYIKLYVGANGVHIDQIKISLREPLGDAPF